MRYGAYKSLVILAVILGGSASAVFVWSRLPAETLSGTLALLANALGVWLATSALTFIMLWIFYKLIVGIGRYIYDRFYRTPTL